MSDSQNHIVGKISLNVKTTERESANSVRNNTDDLLKNVLLIKLEEILDEYGMDKTIRFDKIYLDFFISEWDNRHEIAHAFENNLRKELEKAFRSLPEVTKTTKPDGEISAKENEVDVFLFFLKNGFLPWYGKGSYISELIQPEKWNQSIQSKSFRQKLSTLFIQNENALTRFTLQVPVARIIDYLAILQPETKSLAPATHTLLGSIAENFHPQLLKITLLLIFSEKEEPIVQNIKSLTSITLTKKEEREIGKTENNFRKLNEWISEYFPERKEVSTAVEAILEKHKGYKPQKENENISDLTNLTPTNRKQEFEQETTESFFKGDTTEIIVQNAGLILLHPFLKTFFTEIGILKENGNFSPDDEMLALQTLHFLATGNETFFEANMIFEKYMTGIPLQMPVPRASILTDEIKAEANEMLRQVIKHWPALKNTSADGLRQNFLQRDGKLIQNEKNYRLLVERKTQDILLERIDWNISVVKLPWMKNLIHVEW